MSNQQAQGAGGPIDVLVVDDSAFMRKMVCEILAADPALRVVGTARDGMDAVVKIHEFNPRVVTLDIEMPGMDGYAVLERLAERPPGSPPLSVVMLSSLTQAGAEATLRCLDLGAVDVIGKPSGSISLDIKTVGADVIAKVKAAAGARIPLLTRRAAAALQSASTFQSSPMLRPASILPAPACRPGSNVHSPPPMPATPRLGSHTAAGILVIGSSTGGPRALQRVIPMLDPARLGMPVVIVQHMPPNFTNSLAMRLEMLSPHGLKVREATEGDVPEAGLALVAPGGRHLIFDERGRAHLTDEPPVHGVRPSVDVTMLSLIKAYKSRMIGVLLTGMGRDGARALKMLRDLGGHTIVESEESCIVYGMPRAAIELGGAEQVLPLPAIAEAILETARTAHERAA